jgi:UDP-N-acetylmuramate dehydrogenase
MRLLRDLPGEVRPGEELSRHTTFRIGGPAWCLFFPTTVESFVEAISRARREGIPWYILGRGSNVLFPDTGFPGLVISTKSLVRIEATGDGVVAEAGAPLAALVPLGYGALAGIPGTVGGAVAMNAGTRQGEVGEYVVAVGVLGRDGVPRRIPASACGFAYRSSRLKRLGLPVLWVELSRPESDVDPAQVIRARYSQPVELPSAGCVFRNPPDAPPAGWLIERAGLKGKRIGDALVSPRHANFICNLGRAKAAEVLALMDLVRERVRRVFGVFLEPELEIVWA